MTSKTSNICNILSPLCHAYFQQITLAVFKVVIHVWSETSFMVSLVGSPVGRVLQNRVLLSFCPSYSLSNLSSECKFSRNWLISFFVKLSMVLGTHIYLYVKELDPHQARMTKNSQKRHKNWFFGLFKKIKLLVLFEIGVKQKFLRSFIILRKLHAWKISGSQVMTIEISVFFNRQCLINGSISGYDFWNVDIHEWKEQGLLTGFLKNYLSEKWAHFGSKNGTST